MVRAYKEKLGNVVFNYAGLSWALDPSALHLKEDDLTKKDDEYVEKKENTKSLHLQVSKLDWEFTLNIGQEEKIYTRRSGDVVAKNLNKASSR